MLEELYIPKCWLDWSKKTPRVCLWWWKYRWNINTSPPKIQQKSDILVQVFHSSLFSHLKNSFLSSSAVTPPHTSQCEKCKTRDPLPCNLWLQTRSPGRAPGPTSEWPWSSTCPTLSWLELYWVLEDNRVKISGGRKKKHQEVEPINSPEATQHEGDFSLSVYHPTVSSEQWLHKYVCGRRIRLIFDCNCCGWILKSLKDKKEMQIIL